ncbi:MAG: phosphate acetyltransferase [Clostridia bacterium]|nr:phosphate acetyltransferase [Clostridia bacterium]
MGLLQRIREKAKADRKRIVLAEGTEERTVRAAAQVTTQGIADVTLVGDEQAIRRQAQALGVDLTGVQIRDPAASPRAVAYADLLHELRKEKGMTREAAEKLIAENPLYFATMMLKTGDADGLVAGAIHTTGEVLRPALQIIKTAPGIKVVSSCFLMECPDRSYGQDGVLVFADCAVIPNPTAEELAGIAISSAQTAKALAGMEPKVAMLSFSTKGSARHELVTKVQEATRIARAAAPELAIDGELQADAALVASVGKLKSPDSPVAGEANVLVFPDLQAGNIGYKLVQRLAGAEAVGPVIQGLAKPVNDLSRGCSVEDIVSVVAIAAVQASAQ